MTFDVARRVADAVLYEGYALFPYGPSLKNRRRLTFGGLVPRAASERRGGRERFAMSCACLVEGPASARVTALVRFLAPMERRLECLGGEHDGAPVARLGTGEGLRVAFVEANERAIETPSATLDELAVEMRLAMRLESTREEELVREGDCVIGREIRERGAIALQIRLRAEPLAPGLHRVIVAVENETPVADASELDAFVALHTMEAAHAILSVEGAAFVSAIDPPEALAAQAAACKHDGAFPVLAGAPGERGVMLCSPIILHDHPEVAPESHGDLFDCTENDELLTLSVLALSDEERSEARALDPRARAIVDRAERLRPEELERLHGAVRSFISAGGDGAPLVRRVRIGSVSVGRGDRVRLRPRGRADAFDLLLGGRIATVLAVERDVADRAYLAVTVDDDPGRALGEDGRSAGHRFYFGADEVEPLGGEP